MANVTVNVHPEAQLLGGEFRFTEEELEVLAAASNSIGAPAAKAEREGEDNVQEHSSAEVDVLMKKFSGG